jgi:hypothetical protein
MLVLSIVSVCCKSCSVNLNTVSRDVQHRIAVRRRVLSLGSRDRLLPKFCCLF